MLSASSDRDLTLLSQPFRQPLVQEFGRRSYLPNYPETIWQIQQGFVRTLFWHPDGNTVTLGIWGEGDIVGQNLSCLDPYYLECLTLVKAIPLPTKDWQNHPQTLCAYLKQLEALTIIRSHRHIEDRLISLLNWLGHKFGQLAPAGYLIDVRLTHQDIADMVGTTRVTVTRLLSKLEIQGMIERRSVGKLLVKETDCWYYEI
ncbi:MAG: Crp/Fnr family transcriptional regulator [Synechococcales bacterium]|nr:Crp/Fnr family transcriptional regulator [Synechococcales bacterium]